MTGMSLSLGLSLSSLAGSGGTPTPTPAPVITFDGTTFANTLGNAGPFLADGVAIEGETGATMAYVEATMAGRAIQQSVGGLLSNVIVVEAAGPPITVDEFDGVDNSLLTAPANGGWIAEGGTQPADAARGTVLAGQAKITSANASGSPVSYHVFIKDTGSVEHFVETTVNTANGYVIFKYLDSRKYLYFQHNNWGTDDIIISSYIDGTTTSQIAGTSGGFRVPGIDTDGADIRIEVTDTHFKFFARVGAETEYTQYLVKVGSNNSLPGTTAYAIPAGFEGASKVGMTVRNVPRYFDNIRFGSITRPIVLSVISQARSPDDSNKTRVVLGGTYGGGVTAIEFLVTLADGTLVQNWAAGSALAGGVIDQYVDVPFTSGEQFKIYGRDPSAPATVASVAPTAPILAQIDDTVLGMNEGYIAPWTTSDAFTDLGNRVEWRKTDNKYIYRRGQAATGGNVATSADGEGGTVKMDLDGRIYGYNTAGITTYRFGLPNYHSETGDYIITLAPGLSLTRQGGATGWTYDSGTGDLTYTVTTTDYVTFVFDIVCSSIPPSGLLPTVRLAGTTLAAEPTLRTQTAATYAALSSYVRAMTPRDVSGWTNTENGATDTQAGVDTPANYFTGGRFSVRHHLAHAKAGLGVWYNCTHTAGDALISADAALLASSSYIGLVFSEYSNEPWNSSSAYLEEFHHIILEGYRRGYAAPGITTHAAAVPETIINGRPYVNRGNLLVSGRSFAAGDKIYVDLSGSGYYVVQATTAITPGMTLSWTTSPNCTLVYSNWGTAALRYLGRRSKEIWTLQDAEFISRGKPRPLHVLAWQSGTNLANFQIALDFDDIYQDVDIVSCAWYWGTGLSSYTSTTAGWTEADRDKWYGGDSAGFISTFCAKAPSEATAKVNDMATFCNALAAYSLAKRGNKNAIRAAGYELNHHITFSGWPCMAGAFDAATAYSPKAFVYNTTDGQTYRNKQINRGVWATATSYALGDYFTSGGTTYYVTTAHTSTTAPPNANVSATNPCVAGTPLSDTTYWGVFVDSNGATWDAAKTLLHRASAPRAVQGAWNALSRSQAFADVQAIYFGDGVRTTGIKYFTAFDRIKVAATGANTTTDPFQETFGWNVQISEMDTDVSGGAGTNWQYKMLTELKTSMGAGA